MLAAYTDQENRIHGQRVAAAAKSQAHGAKPLGAKTPGQKVANTPLKIGLNDENATYNAGGKSALGKRGDTAVVKKDAQAVGKKGNAAKNVLFTPAGPQRRAPLGMKTTNAKAFQTPGPLTANNKAEKTLQATVSPRLRRSKVKVHQGEAISEPLGEETIPEVEYCPPKAAELPDLPSDDEDGTSWGLDKKFPMFEGDNATMGWAQVYLNPIMDNGETYLERKEREERAQAEADLEAMENKSLADHWRETEARLGEEFAELGIKSTALPPPAGGLAAPSKPDYAPMKKSVASAHISSRLAATALAQPKRPVQSTDPKKTAPAQTATRQPFTRKTPLAPKRTAQMAARPNANAGPVAARSTLGYSKGRMAVSRLHRQEQENEVATLRGKAMKKIPSALDDLDLGGAGGDGGLFGVYRPGEEAEDGEDEVFQLRLGM